MISILRRFVFLFLLLLSLQSSATHLIGGYFQYEFLGTRPGDSVEYEVTLYLYVDCGVSASSIIENAAYTVFDATLQVGILNDELILVDDSILPDDINNPCVVSGPNVCVKEEVYKGTVMLSRIRPHLLTYQRCCRNLNIDNLVLPLTQGSTITTLIPAFNAINSNNTPVFNDFPPISICSGFDVNLDLSANDPDGDSLVYSLCAPLNYDDNLNVRPIPADPPPYFSVNYSTGFSATNPLPASPALSLNPSTGRLNGVPTSIGKYVLAYCVEEYRNGQLINMTRRSIQVNTGSCNPVISSAVQDQVQFCDGLTVQFKNNSTSNVTIRGYKWDFGDPNTLADTSRLFEPTYTYPDTGLYTITLTANPDIPCSNTTTKDFKVYKKLSPSLDVEGKVCLDDNRINFVARGLYEDYASFLWDFGSAANISSSTLDSVPGVVFNGAGTYQVKLIVSQDGCSDTLTQQVQLFENPIADFSYSPIAGCYPLPVSFVNTSFLTGTAEFLWDFGDGNSSTAFSPVHTYQSNGYFDVKLELKSTSDCLDTVLFEIDSAVHVSLDSSKNEIKFGLDPKEICLGTPVFFYDSSFYEGGADYFWDFGNNQMSTERNPKFTYTDTGYYSIGLLLITKDKCVDTLQLTLDSALRVNPNPVSSLEIPELNLPLKEANFTFDARKSEAYTGSAFFLNGNLLAQANLFDYSIRDTGHYQVMHIATNSFGCTDTSLATLFVYDEFEFIVPNIFTPNGDLVNDQFQVRACGVYDYEIQIWNRYGQEVFRSQSMNVNWDGRVNGKSVNSGTFFYKIRIKDFLGEYREYTGPFSLLRD